MLHKKHIGYSFIARIKTEDIYVKVAKDIETSFDTWNDKLDRPLLRRKNKNITGLMKGELGVK